MSHSWPGNIRELQNAILAAAVDAPRNIGTVHLSQHLSGKADLPKVKGMHLPERITSALEDSGRMTLAQIHADLQVPKPTIHRHLKRMMAEGKVLRTEVSGQVLYALHGIERDAKTHLTPRQERAVVITREKGHITRQELSKALGVSTRTASRDLAFLMGFGLLVSDGQPGKLAGYYTVNND